MNGHTPKISVCIPVYNCAEYIGNAIESVLSQSFSDFELIIVDNKSTDRTIEVVKTFSDDRIQVYQNDTNLGMLGNWNRTLELAHGEYIKILPADDFLYPGCLDLQRKVLDSDFNKTISLVCGRKNIINDKGKILFSRGFSRKGGEFKGNDAINRAIRSGGNIIGEPGAVMFRKELIKKSGNFDSEFFYVTDLSFWLKLLLYGNLYFVPDVVCSFRISGVSESIKKVATQKRDVDSFIRKVYSNKAYRVSTLNYRIGLINSYLLAVAKKLIYKFSLG
jgi:glycosyltransferase involved in cell wall biosynthesis